MDVPSAADVISWSKVAFDQLDSPFLEADLATVVPRAAAYISAVTGRVFGDDSFPPPLIPLGQEAVQYRVEQMCYQAQPDVAEEYADDQVHNFSAGQYSETRQDLAAPGAKTGVPMINTHTALNRLLWLIMTDDQRSYWWALFTGAQVPAFEVSEIDWGNYDGLYPYSYGIAHGHNDPWTWGG